MMQHIKENPREFADKEAVKERWKSVEAGKHKAVVKG